MNFIIIIKHINNLSKKFRKNLIIRFYFHFISKIFFLIQNKLFKKSELEKHHVFILIYI